MGTVYEISRTVLRFLYGVFAAFFMYNPSGQTTSLQTLIAQLLGNPCEIQNGLFGMLLLPSNAVLIGIILVIVGVAKLGISFYKTMASWLGNVFAIVTSSLSYLTSALRIGERRRLGHRGYGYEGQGYREGPDEVNLFQSLASSLAFILVGAILVAASQDQSGSLVSLTSALGSLISGIIMTIAAALSNAANSIIAISLGQAVVPLCQL